MEKKGLKQNLLFAAVILAAAALLFALRGWRSARYGSVPVYAQLTYGEDNAVMELSLEQDGRYDVDTGLYIIHLEVRDGAVGFVDSPCPDHICEHYGFLSQADQQAVCLPAKAVLMIVPKE